MREVWKDISGYEGIYQASSYGRIKSLGGHRSNGYYKKEKIMKFYKTYNGYYRVGLSKNGESKGLFVHRIIATTFIPNPNSLRDVNHKDENKINNNIENLEWLSHQDNINYGSRKRRMMSNKEWQRKTMQETSIPVYSVSPDGKIEHWYSQHEAARQLGLQQSCISGCLRGKQKTTGGYKFFKDEDKDKTFIIQMSSKRACESSKK